ncbi:MAG: tRNA (adenosine(37)-N6)-threonylcarbamoyltransferase complex ATPase subunit type 1 TsaE [Bacteroidota bacterium]|nr:tRNA (adenosine(37)-N6)-threonylcarbamoyltransferase complex ATPase subunit type 1 TsaE [Bacteroidota bacterium]
MKIELNSLEELPAAAKKMLKSFGDEKVILFYGEMGAGKTTLIKALCEELGVKDVVTSPTYSIVNQYKSASGQKIYHFDFYRINSEDEAYDMGYEDYFYSKSYCLVEWPEKISSLLPLTYEKVTITKLGEQRIIDF